MSTNKKLQLQYNLSNTQYIIGGLTHRCKNVLEKNKKKLKNAKKRGKKRLKRWIKKR